LTDHYNPVNKTVNLSEAVYNPLRQLAAWMWTCGTTCRGLSMVNYAKFPL
jgi:hypothetical protein